MSLMLSAQCSLTLSDLLQFHGRLLFPIHRRIFYKQTSTNICPICSSTDVSAVSGESVNTIIYYIGIQSSLNILLILDPGCYLLHSYVHITQSY